MVTEDGNVVVRGPKTYAGPNTSAYTPNAVLWDLREAWGIPSDLNPPVWLTLQVGAVAASVPNMATRTHAIEWLRETSDCYRRILNQSVRVLLRKDQPERGLGSSRDYSPWLAHSTGL